MKKVTMALPKGSLEKDTFDFLRRSAFEIVGEDRSYRPIIDDREMAIKILRPQEIPTYVQQGFYDLGISGLDWIKESGSDVKDLLDLEYGWVKLVVGAPKQVYGNSDDIIERNAGKRLRISTEYPKLTSSFLMGLKSYKSLYGDRKPVIYTPWWKMGENDDVAIYLSFGATEAKPPEEADLVVDVTQTGATLEQNDLKPIDLVTESTAHLIANRDSLKDSKKREKILDIVALFKGTLESRKKYHIFVNVKEKNLQELLDALPSLKGPTVNKLSKPGWYAVNTVIDKAEYRKLLPTFRRLAQGLVIHSPRSIMSLEALEDEIR
ncbi:MAG: ATP phosphoribosyltransferase [Nitrososphaerota archaeon]|nr:ATP phosphoribosyltransferase [Nitrososphaerota archaeon]MDG7050856.1 ATP phosphoribosyltransferase [Nitrososphaerota archaeon]